MGKFVEIERLALVVLCGIVMMGCEQKPSDSSTERPRRNSLDSIVVSDITHVEPKKMPDGVLIAAPLTTTKETSSQSSRSVTKRGDMVILIDRVTRDSGDGTTRQQRVFFDGRPLCSIGMGEAKPVLYASEGSTNVRMVDCNGDGLPDFLLVTDADNRMLEGFSIGKDRLFLPIPSSILYDEHGRIRSADGVIREYERQLHEAVESRKIAHVKTLLSKGISPNARDLDGNALLHSAVLTGDPKLVQLLLRAGASRETTNRKGLTPYDLALSPNHERVLNYLKSVDDEPVYLADLPPQHASVGWGNFTRYHSKSSGLSIAGRRFKTGFYAHANSSIKYVLGGEYERFTSSFGLTTGAGGVAKFEVWVDGKRRFRSADMYSRGNSVGYGHVGMSVDIRGAKFLELKSIGVRSCNGSHSAWGDPKLYRPEHPFLSDKIVFPKTDGVLTGFLSVGASKVVTIGDDQCQSWDVSTGEAILVKTYPVGSNRRNHVAWIDNASIIAVAEGPKIELMTAKAAGGMAREPWTLPAPVSCLFSPKWRSFLVAGTTDRKLYLWNPAETKVVWKRSNLPAYPVCIAYCALRDEIAVGLTDGKGIVLKASTGELVKVIEGHAFSVKHLRFSPSGRKLVSCGNDLVVNIWDTSDYERKGQFNRHTGIIKAVEFLTEDLVVSVDSDSDALIWDTRTRDIVWRLAAPDAPQDLGVDHTTKRLYMCGKKELFSFDFHQEALVPRDGARRKSP